MGYKAKTSGAEVVSLSAGYEATIRVLRKADEDALQVALLGSSKSHRQYVVEDGISKLVSDQTIDNSAYTRELLVRGIVSWTLDDDNGSPLAVTPETVELLTGTDSTRLAVAIKALSARLDLPKEAVSPSV